MHEGIYAHAYTHAYHHAGICARAYILDSNIKCIYAHARTHKFMQVYMRMHTYTYAHTCVRTRVCECECVMTLCTHARRDDFCVQRPQRRISSTMSSAGSCRTHNANANPKEGVYAELADNSSFFPQKRPFAERFVSRFVAPSARPLFL